MNSELRGKTAIDLTTQHLTTSTETLQSNGNSNGHHQLQPRYSKMGHASPGAESFLSMEEVNILFPYIFSL